RIGNGMPNCTGGTRLIVTIDQFMAANQARMPAMMRKKTQRKTCILRLGSRQQSLQVNTGARPALPAMIGPQSVFKQQSMLCCEENATCQILQKCFQAARNALLRRKHRHPKALAAGLAALP